MFIIKQLKDQFTKMALGKSVPRGLFESREYFRTFGPIHFQINKEGGFLIAKSTNFHWGTIITYAKNSKELKDKIEDAILTSFEIPSSYAKEASIHEVGSTKTKKEYALA